MRFGEVDVVNAGPHGGRRVGAVATGVGAVLVGPLGDAVGEREVDRRAEELQRGVSDQFILGVAQYVAKSRVTKSQDAGAIQDGM